MTKIIVDQEKCIGCGRCTEICPDVFKLNQNRKSEVLSHEKNIACAKKASDECPTEAIEVEQ
ncbi:MAG: ferredoxin [Candidatus Moranbacteria bacterium]|nr:ferredoxin [Candidatus Moranbacteria bacterium]